MQTRPVPREAVLIVNTRSRRGGDYFREARRKLEQAGVRITGAYAVSRPEQLMPTMAQAVNSGAPMIIVGGGDGSLSCVIDAVVGRDCVFALLPLGTANSFARTLGIPLDLDGAIRTIVTGKRRRIDLGVVNGDYFGNAASLGMSPVIGETVPHGLKRHLGRLGYFLWALWCLLHFRPFRLTVHNDGERWSAWATEVRIFNGNFHSGIELLESDEIDDGVIVIQAVTGKSLLPLAWDWFARLLKLPGRSAAAEEFRGKKMRITTRPRVKISVDGEVLTATPAVVACAHKAIEVVVPEDGEAENEPRSGRSRRR